ncbi:MAG: RES family NAD+ phosphorylase [Gemmatimonadetes bacterium]|nr:RES family NAD+ phosphorylase [Gemmatimonadota bacterium]
MTPPPRRVWRVFPWDAAAPEGEPFSLSYVPRAEGKGRFDLPGVPGSVLYLAETPEHAVAEMLQHYRGQALDDADLLIGGHRLALVFATLSDYIRAHVIDLCDPEVLVSFGIRPDETASGDRRVTQRIAARIHAGGHAGLRWWSALFGEWHTVALFRDQLQDQPEYGAPEFLELGHAAVREAARSLGIRIGMRRSSARADQQRLG